ncbi:MAG: hypothetical protein PHE24_05545 [Patescibacteria group bacterium]|nr:hypothetical protein [Patescibacteria group bacterium]
MIMLLATLIIVIFFTTFFYLFANIFIPLFFDIPATIRLGQKNIIKQQPVLKKYIITISAYSIAGFIILLANYYFFIKYSFGFSISIFIGAGLGLLGGSWKIIWLFFRKSDNYLKWLDFYRKDNSYYLKTIDINILNEALGNKIRKVEK